MSCCREPGLWVQLPFNQAAFTANGSMTWTVAAGNVLAYAFSKFGDTAIFSVMVGTSVIGGTASNELRIALPTGLVVRRPAGVVCRIGDATTPAAGFAQVGPGGPNLIITNLNFGQNFALTSSFSVTVEIIFEIW